MKSKLGLAGMLACALTTWAVVAAGEGPAAKPCCVDEAAVLAGEKKPAAEPFDILKSLVGKWVDGGPEATDKATVKSEFRVTAGGSVLIETMMPGTKMEMINMYTRDGDDIFLVHYCAIGNQPRMKLVSHDNGVLKFEVVSVGNLKSEDAPYMSGLELTIAGGNIVQNWSNTVKGKVESHASFQLARKAD
jgi:hypothetical protein